MPYHQVILQFFNLKFNFTPRDQSLYLLVRVRCVYTSTPRQRVGP